MGAMEKRVGFVGIIIQDRKKWADEVNKVLSEFGDIIVVRTGVPHVRDQFSVIALVVDATPDQVGALTGKLGEMAGISVKSMLSKQEEN
jgi:putative iron-only hydrogenase system regulator